MRTCIPLILLMLLSLGGFSISSSDSYLTVKGTVYGIDMKQGKGLFKKNPAFYMEGGLDNVAITVSVDDSTHHRLTEPNGDFSLTLPRDRIIKIGVSKNSYQAITFLFDTRGIPEDYWRVRPLFSDLELILRRLGDVPLDLVDNLGRLYYNSNKGHMDFATSPNRASGQPKPDNALVLIDRAIERNKTLTSLEVRKLPPAQETRVAADPEVRTRIVKVVDSVTIDSDFDLSRLEDGTPIGQDDIAGRRRAIEEARMRLELDQLQASTVSDSLLLLYRSNQIQAAEQELKSAQRLIEVQQSEITSQEESVKFLALSLSLLLILISVAFIFYKDKIRVNRILRGKNRRIVESLSYAKRIQQAILIPEKEIQQCLPSSFVYYQPRDIVSGDFYWFSKVSSKIVLAAVDCTGHGVPGAFMSLIGNTLMNEIILEKGILDPAEILESLDRGVRESLHQNENGTVSQDGMEMSICVIEPKTRTVNYAGAVVPIYIVDKDQVKVVKGTSRSIGGSRGLNGSRKKKPFENHKFVMENGAEVFMFTDGYMDQFGGPKQAKYSAQRFKDLLTRVQAQSMDDQKTLLEETFKEWKGESAQTDDTLVMGFKF